MKSIVVKNNTRFGKHLEVNILGDKKICSFNCVYCSLGPTEVKLKELKELSIFPQFEDVLFDLKSSLLSIGSQIDCILVSGNGEPTLAPGFFEFSQMLHELIAEQAQGVKSIIITNAAHFDQRKLVDAASTYSEVIIRLDAGTESQHKIINEPLIRGGIDRIIANARKIKNPIVQTAIFSMNGIIPARNHFDDYCETVGMLDAKAIHLLRLSDTSTNKSLLPASQDEIEEFAALLRRKFLFEVRVFN